MRAIQKQLKIYGINLTINEIDAIIEEIKEIGYQYPISETNIWATIIVYWLETNPLHS